MSLLNPEAQIVLPKVRGLSLTRPWPWAFVNGEWPKRIENRSWKPPQSIISTHYIALHAAQSWNEDDRSYIQDATGLYVPPRHDHQHSAIFAACRISQIVDEINAPSVLEESQMFWFFGPYGWVVEGFVALVTPVVCKGAQGLWGFRDKQKELTELRCVYAQSLVRRRLDETNPTQGGLLNE